MEQKRVETSQIGSSQLPVKRFRDGSWSNEQDHIADEQPVALVFNGVSHAVMLATPDHLEEFALGFSLSEGIASKAEDVYDIELTRDDQGCSVNLTISNEAAHKLKQHRRTLTGRTGCGLCGAEALEHAIQTIHRVESSLAVNPEHISVALNNLQNFQPLKQKTGAVHGAAWANQSGEIQLCREDVGRHNALDKLLGACVKNKTDFNTGFIVISSRASYEMIQKAGRCGVGIVAAVSAPTSLAVNIANQSNMMLIGFARDNSFVVYAHPEKLTTSN